MKLKIFIFVIVFSSFLLFVCIYPLSKDRNTTEKSKLLQNLKNTTGSSFKFYENQKNGYISMSGNLSKRNAADGSEALKFIDEIKPILSIKDTYKNFIIKSINKDELGYTNIKIIQIYNNIPVESASISVHFNESNIVTNITSNINYDVINSSQKLKKNITKEDAYSLIKNEFADKNPQIKYISDIVISKNSHVYFCYKYAIYYTKDKFGSYDIYVDMNSGKIVDKKDNIRYHK